MLKTKNNVWEKGPKRKFVLIGIHYLKYESNKTLFNLSLKNDENLDNTSVIICLGQFNALSNYHSSVNSTAIHPAKNIKYITINTAP